MSFGGGSGSSSISSSTDATISTPANNEVLGYNAGTAKWQNQPKTTGPCITCDPRTLKATVTTFPAANRTYYMRVQGEVFGATAYRIWVGTASGNISIANYANTGVGTNAAPTGAPRGATGSVACPATGAQLVFASGGAFNVAEGDWIGLSCNNATASFGSGMDTAPITLYAGICAANNVFPAGTPNASYTATTPFFLAAEVAVAGVTPPSFISATPPGATVNAAYSYAFTASGSPAPTFALTAGSIPTGTTLSSSGVLSGTPTTAGTATYTITASNGAAPNATTSGSIVVAASGGGGTAPSFTAAIPPNGTVGVAYSYQFAASGTTPIAFTLNSGTIPAGLTLTSAGLLSGTPTTAVTYNFTVLASNGVAPDRVSTQKTVIIAASGGGGGGSPAWLGDYQTGDFSQWADREFKDGATSADMARQQQIVTSPARAGFPNTARFDVISTDQTSGDPGRNRSEVTDYNDPGGANGMTTWWAWSMYLPAGFHVDSDAQSPVGNGWLIFTQWHGDGGGPGPNIAFELTKGTSAPQIIFETSGDAGAGVQAYWVQPTPIPLGQWVDFVVGVTWGTTVSTGRVTVIVNGSRWLDNVAAATLYPGQYSYFKQGIYRARSNQDQYIYYTGTRRGPTEASVSY